jgi:hypothetical protein
VFSVFPRLLDLDILLESYTPAAAAAAAAAAASAATIMSSDRGSTQTPEKAATHAEAGIDHVDTNVTTDNVLKIVHTDGTVNYVDHKAVGGDLDQMPKGYFRSPQFIGTVTVSRKPCGPEVDVRHVLDETNFERPSSRPNVWAVSVPMWAGSCLQTPCKSTVPKSLMSVTIWMD